MTTLTEQDLSGYELTVYPHFSVYGWRLELSVFDFTGYCTDDTECGCCDCGKVSMIRNTYSRPRYSKSRKVWVLETNTIWLCSEHLENV